jgi:hypothetical protein
MRMRSNNNSKRWTLVKKGMKRILIRWKRSLTKFMNKMLLEESLRHQESRKKCYHLMNIVDKT